MSAALKPTPEVSSFSPYMDLDTFAKIVVDATIHMTNETTMLRKENRMLRAIMRAKMGIAPEEIDMILRAGGIP